MTFENPKDIDYRERVYQMFLPEIQEMDRLSLFGDLDLQKHRYDEQPMEHRIAAAAIYGVAKRLNFSIARILPNTSEGYKVKKALRGKFLDSTMEAYGNLSYDEVKHRLAEYGITQDDITGLAQRMDKTLGRCTEALDFHISMYGDESDTDEEEMDYDVTDDKPSEPLCHRVTKIEPLFRIQSDAGRCGIYARAQTVSAGYSDTIFYWDNTQITVHQPDLSTDLVFEFTSLVHSKEGYLEFLERVVGEGFWLNGHYDESAIKEMIGQLEKDLEQRK
jgi:hypothetical protein